MKRPSRGTENTGTAYRVFMNTLQGPLGRNRKPLLSIRAGVALEEQ